jgi:hypothetical protein
MTFNGDISKWDVSSVQQDGRMFERATAFNGDIPNGMYLLSPTCISMFSGAAMFESGDISWMFFRHQRIICSLKATAFNGDISNGTFLPSSNGLNIRGATTFNDDVSKWDVVSSVTNMGFMFWRSYSVQWRYFRMGCIYRHHYELNVRWSDSVQC